MITDWGYWSPTTGAEGQINLTKDTNADEKSSCCRAAVILAKAGSSFQQKQAALFLWHTLHSRFALMLCTRLPGPSRRTRMPPVLSDASTPTCKCCWLYVQLNGTICSFWYGTWAPSSGCHPNMPRNTSTDCVVPSYSSMTIKLTMADNTLRGKSTCISTCVFHRAVQQQVSLQVVAHPCSSKSYTQQHVSKHAEQSACISCANSYDTTTARMPCCHPECILGQQFTATSAGVVRRAEGQRTRHCNKRWHWQ